MSDQTDTQHDDAAEFDVDTLIGAYAGGNLPPALDALVEAQLEISPVNRPVLAMVEAVNGRLLEDETPIAPSRHRDMLADILAMPRDAAPAETPAPETQDEHPTGLPAALRRLFGIEGDEIPWRGRMGGIREVTLAGKDGAKAILLWVRAGQAMPSHTHRGQEITLVLRGGFSDETGHYVRGDIAIADETVDHKPVADEGEDCICFTVIDAPLRFTGPMGWLISPFAR